MAARTIPTLLITACLFQVTTCLAAAGTGRLAVFVHSNSQPVAGAWLKVVDAAGHSVDSPAFASTADGVARVYELPPGTYVVQAVQPSFDPSSPLMAQVTAGALTRLDAEVSPVPLLSLANTQGHAWSLLAIAPQPGRVFVPPRDLSPALPSYAFAGSVDPGSQTAWIPNVPVPSDIGGSSSGGVAGLIQDFGYFWYRYAMPPTAGDDARFRDRLWVVQGFTVTEEDNTYWNGRLIGATRRAPGFDPSSNPRLYPLSAGELRTDGSLNVLAVYGRHEVGPGGITSGVPALAGVPRSAGNLSVTVQEEAGQPLDGVDVSITSPDGAFHPVIRTEGGRPALFVGVPAGHYTLSVARPYGMETVPDTDVEAIAGQTTPLTVAVSSSPFLALDSASLATKGLPGWDLLPIPVEQAAAAAPDVTIANPGYQEGFVDATFNTEWVPDVPVPLDLGAGSPPDPSRPVQDGSYFWYRLKLHAPAGWAAVANSDLRLSGFAFAGEDWTFVNGILVGHTRDGRLRDYRIPRSAFRFDGDNVVAIKGRALQGQAGIVSGGVVLSFWPRSPADQIVRGDVSGNGRVDIEDAILALRASLGLITPSPEQVRAGDLLRHGRIDMADAGLLIRAAIGLLRL